MAALAVLAGPVAGSGRGAATGPALVAGLRALGHEVLDVTGPSARASLEGARRAVADGAAALVVVGGDGTVQLGAAAVAQTGVPLGVVPAGSGNDAARSLGLAALSRGGPQAAARRLHQALAARPAGRAVDLLQVTAAGGGEPRWVVGVLAAGFDAAVNARANTWARPGAGALVRRLPGRARYTAAVLAELPAWRPRAYRLVFDGREVRCDAVLVAVAGTTTYGGGLRIAPRAVPDDGLADVVVVGALSRAALLALLPTVFAGWHVHHPAVTVHRAARVEVALLDDPGGPGGPPLVAHGDGEPVTSPPLVCQVVPGALRLLA